MKTPKDLTAAVSRACAKLNELGFPVKYTQALSAIAAYHGFSNREEFIADAKKVAAAPTAPSACATGVSPPSLVQLHALTQSMMTVLDSLAAGEQFDDVVESTGITARVIQFQRDLRDLSDFDEAVPPSTQRPVEGEVITSPARWEARYMQLWDSLSTTMGNALDDVEQRLIARGYNTNRGGRPGDHLGLRLEVLGGPGTNVTYPFCIEFTLYDGLHDAGPVVLAANVDLNFSDASKPTLASLSPYVGSSGFATELACFEKATKDWQKSDVIFDKAIELLEGSRSMVEPTAAERAKGISCLTAVKAAAYRYCDVMDKPDAVGVRYFGSSWVLVLRYLDFERTLSVSTAGTYEDARFVAHAVAYHFGMSVETVEGYAKYLARRWNRDDRLSGVDTKCLKRIATALLDRGFMPGTEQLVEMTKQIAPNAYQFCIVQPASAGARGDIALNIDTSTFDGDYLTESPTFLLNFADMESELARLSKTLSAQVESALLDPQSRSVRPVD